MRSLRTILAILLFFAVLALLLVAALAFWITPERISSRIEHTLEEHLGLRAEFSAPLTVKRLPDLEIRLPATTLSCSGSGEKVGTIASGLIRLHPWAIFAQSPRVEHVLLDGLSVDLQSTVCNSLTTNATNTNAIAFWNARLVEVRNGNLTLKAPAPVTLSALDARLEDMTETGGILRLAGNLESPTMSGPVTLAGHLSIRPGVDSLFARTTLDSASATLDGLWNTQSVHADFTTAHAEPTQEGWLLQGSSLHLQTPDGSSWQVSSDNARLSEGRLDADALSAAATLKLPAGTLAATASGRTNVSLKPVAVSLENAVINTTFTPEAVPNTASSAPLKGQVTGRVAFSELGDADIDLSGTLLGDAFSAKVRPNTQESQAYSLTGEVRFGALQTTLLSQLPLDPTWLSHMHFEGEVSAESLREIPGLTNLAAHASFADGTLTLSSGRADWLQGRVDFVTYLAPDGEWRADIRARDLLLEEGFQKLGRPVALSGRTEGTLRLAGTLHPEVGQSALSQADGRIILRDGAFYGIDAPQARRVLFEELPAAIPTEVLRSEASTRFSRLAFATTLREGRITVTDGLVEGPTSTEGVSPWQASLAGDLRANKLELNLVFDFPAEAQLPAFTLATHAQTDAQLTPAWTIDWQAALAAAEAARSDEPTTLKSLGRRVERAIRNFWQELELPKIEMPNVEMPKLPEMKMPEMPWQKENPEETQPSGQQAI